MIHTLNRVYVTLYIILYVYICVQQAVVTWMNCVQVHAGDDIDVSNKCVFHST